MDIEIKVTINIHSLYDIYDLVILLISNCQNIQESAKNAIKNAQSCKRTHSFIETTKKLACILPGHIKPYTTIGCKGVPYFRSAPCLLHPLTKSFHFPTPTQHGHRLRNIMQFLNGFRFRRYSYG